MKIVKSFVVILYSANAINQNLANLLFELNISWSLKQHPGGMSVAMMFQIIPLIMAVNYLSMVFSEGQVGRRWANSSHDDFRSNNPGYHWSDELWV